MHKRSEPDNSEEARQLLTQGLWLQRLQALSPATVRPTLRWALEIAAAGDPLPPLGFIADLGHAALGIDGEMKPGREVSLPGVGSGLLRTYEDYVLGKLHADDAFARAADVLRRIKGENRERDQARALAFLWRQFQARSEAPGLESSPAVLKALLASPPQQVLAEGWEGLNRSGLHPLLEEQYRGLIAASRRVAEVLGHEDVFELEHGTALADFGERLALRQVLQAAARLEALLPAQPLRPSAGRQEVATRLLDEDTFPVGGYSSLATRGSIESLLHSQLAFMEDGQRPDLFDIKFVRDELLYYARDENQFLRRRRSFLFALYPDLVATRVKDPMLPYQGGILLLALLVVVVRRLSDWLSTDALHFEFLFLGLDNGGESLAPERELLQIILREAIELGIVAIRTEISAAELVALCGDRARRSLSHCLTLSTADRALEARDRIVTSLRLDGPCPALTGGEATIQADGDEPLAPWVATLHELLQRWM